MQVTTAGLGWLLVVQFVLYGVTWFACGQVTSEERGAARAFGGFIFCVAAAMALSSLRHANPGCVSGVLSMLLYQAAFLLLWRGCAAFTHQAQQASAQAGRHGLWAVALPAVSICALFVACIVQQAFNLHHSYAIHQAGRWNAQMMMGFLIVAGLFNFSFFGLVVTRLVLRLHALTHHDPLTCLHKRRALQTELQREWRRHPRTGRGLAVLALDVDHFKRVNDTHGHLVGDRVLVAAARALRAGARQSDLVARSGGEEFVVVLSITSPAAAWVWAQRLLREVAALKVPCGQGRNRIASADDGSFTVDAPGETESLA